MVPKRRKSSPVKHIETDRLDEGRLAELGEALRNKFADVKNEPIPERLQHLIDAMRAKEIKDDEAL